jgi:hypothetical protein
MKLFIVLRDSKKIYPNYKIIFKILDNPLAKQWQDLFLKNFIDSDHPIEKDYSLKGWVDSWDSQFPRNLKFLCDRMNKAIFKINETMIPLGYEKIDLLFDVEKIKSPHRQILMNKIHHHFETLIGQTWNPSKWYSLADDFTRTAIRNLNNLCHEIESIVYTIEKKQKVHFPMQIFASLNGPNFQGNYFSEKIKQEISIEEYQSFSKFKKWGDIEIYYAQLGKRHKEAYYDNDEEIHNSNISGYRYLTGEFIVTFDPSAYHREVYESLDFHVWLTKQGFDITDPCLALGFPRVAEIDMNQPRLEIINNLRKRDDIYQIGLENDQGEVLHLKTYDYLWTDNDKIITSFDKKSS